jgi:hypothetical protein
MKLVCIGLACRTHGKDENAYKIIVRKLQRENLLAGANVSGRLIM